MGFVLLLSVLIVKVVDGFVSRASRMSLRGLNEKCLVSRVARALDSLSDWSRSLRAMVSAILTFLSFFRISLRCNKVTCKLSGWEYMWILPGFDGTAYKKG